MKSANPMLETKKEMKRELTGKLKFYVSLLTESDLKEQKMNETLLEKDKKIEELQAEIFKMKYQIPIVEFEGKNLDFLE